MSASTPTPSPTLAAIYGHHAQLAAAVDAAVRRVHDAVGQPGDAGPAREGLARLLHEEVLPHAAAEEGTFYAAGAQLPSTARLVTAMIEQHHRLQALVRELTPEAGPLRTAEVAAAIQELFGSHLFAENEVLLPALVEAEVDLDGLLHGMHELLGPDQH